MDVTENENFQTKLAQGRTPGAADWFYSDAEMAAVNYQRAVRAEAQQGQREPYVDPAPYAVGPHESDDLEGVVRCAIQGTVDGAGIENLTARDLARVAVEIIRENGGDRV